MWNLIKTIAYLTALSGFLLILGVAVNAVVPWTWLTNFFVIIRHFAALFDFVLDIDTLFIIIGISFLIEIAYWIFETGRIILNYFRFTQNQ